MKKFGPVIFILFAVWLLASAFMYQQLTYQCLKLNVADTARFSHLGRAAKIVYPIANLASATTLTVPQGRFFAFTGTANVTRMTAGTSGQVVTFICASTETLTDGVNLKLASNFSGTADDVITLVAQDTFWVEVDRSVN